MLPTPVRLLPRRGLPNSSRLAPPTVGASFTANGTSLDAWRKAMPSTRRHVCLLLAAAGVTSRAARAAPEEFVVFAAASLTDVLRAIAKQGGFGSARFSFAATSTLARQVEQGAPAQLFISADEAWIEVLQTGGHVEPGTRRSLAGNRLALIALRGGIDDAVEAAASAVPAGRPPAETAAAVQAALRLGLAKPEARLATGDPAHVPAGRYAQSALTSLGVWEAFKSRLALADNVRGALVLVERGEAPLGIVYRTDALQSGKVRVLALFPAASHPPIVYPAALLRAAGPSARRFHAHLFEPAAQALLREAGFEPGAGR